MDGRKYICKCGKQYEDFSGLLRHVSAHEFSYSCTFCSSVYTSHAHRIRHYRVQHPSEPLPRKTVNVHSNGASNEHCTSSQIQCLRVRQQSRKRREPSPIIASPRPNILMTPQPQSLALVDIKNVMKNNVRNTVAPRIHRNTSRLPINACIFEDILWVKMFLINYAEDHTIDLRGT